MTGEVSKCHPAYCDGVRQVVGTGNGLYQSSAGGHHLKPSSTAVRVPYQTDLRTDGSDRCQMGPSTGAKAQSQTGWMAVEIAFEMRSVRVSVMGCVKEFVKGCVKVCVMESENLCVSLGRTHDGIPAGSRGRTHGVTPAGNHGVNPAGSHDKIHGGTPAGTHNGILVGN